MRSITAATITLALALFTAPACAQQTGHRVRRADLERRPRRRAGQADAIPEHDREGPNRQGSLQLTGQGCGGLRRHAPSLPLVRARL